MDEEVLAETLAATAGETTVRSQGTSGDPTMPPSAVPERIGRYRVDSVLGSGGMGVVYEAFDERLNRRIAIKILRTSKTGERAKARLLREAQSMAQLSHPNVVQVYEVDEFEGQIFVAMEFVEGKTLGEWVREPGRTPEEIINVHIQAARGLHAAHKRGLVHRDFKPDNVLVADEDQRARVLDFGLARLGTDIELQEELDQVELEGQAEEDLTVTGTLLGTPAYMAPEQFKGLPPTPAADQFAFCITLWESLCGQRPHEGRSVAALMLAVTRETIVKAPKPGALTGKLERVLRRGLRAELEERWDSMEILISEIEATDPNRARATLAKQALRAVVIGAVIFAGFATYRTLQDFQELESEALTQLRAKETLERDQASEEAPSPALPTAEIAEAVKLAREVRREAIGLAGGQHEALIAATRCDEPGNCRVHPDLLNSFRETPALMSKEGRVVPALRHGKTVGFKVYDIRPNTALGALGLQNGDMVTAINGEILTSREVAYNAYASVDTRKPMELSVERKGRPMTWTIRADASLEVEPVEVGLGANKLPMPTEDLPVAQETRLRFLIGAIECDSETEHRCHVPLEIKTLLMSNPSLFLEDARIVPMIRDGAPQGFKFYGIQPGSLFEKLGIENGDMIASVGGTPSHDRDALMQLFATSQDDAEFELEFVRKGQPHSLTVVFDPGRDELQAGALKPEADG